MKVLTLTHVFPRSREDTVAPFLWNFQQALVENGIEAIVCAPHNKGLPLKENYPGYRVERFRYAAENMEILAYRGQMHELVFKNFLNKLIFAQYMVCGFVKLCSLLKREKPDLVHVHWWVPSGIIMYAASLLFKTPFIITTHGTDVFIVRKFKFLKSIMKRIFGKAGRIHVISTYLSDYLTENLKIDKNKIDIISMPVREDKIPLQAPGFRDGTKLLFVGRLIKRKGVDVLLKSLELLPESYQLTIVGVGPEEQNLKKLCSDKKLNSRVNFLPNVSPDELPSVFNQSEIFILPSLTDWKGEKEGLGMVLLEAQRMGLALIASKSGGMTDIVIHNETGLLFEEGDFLGLAENIKRYSDREFFEKMVIGAQSHYEKNYAQQTIAKKTVVSYNLARQKLPAVSQNPSTTH
ncbi:group 1 glycosyl transferase [Chitinispirillum alkaliphilum]|nr:group 1 glycosyl transferase [Chitinispirillum alkaliphilum]